MPSSLFLLMTLLGAAHSAQYDPPDLTLEAKLHQNYLSVQGPAAPAPKDGLEVGRLETYALQSGETLWGLSQMLYGDGSYWPRVWAQNSSITNPHLIRKGHTLQFLMGSEDATPAFRFSEPEDGGLELAAATVVSDHVEIPPPSVKSKPIAKIPESFPEWQVIFKGPKDKMRIDDSRMALFRDLPPDKIPLSAYVQDETLEPIGSLLEIEKESGLPVPMQYIYVKVKKGLGHVGDTLLIVHDQGTIHKMNDQVEGRIRAHFIQVFGDLRLTEMVPASFAHSRDREGYEAYRALILHSTQLALTNYELTPGRVEVVDMSRNGPPATVTAQVIGSFKNEASALYGPGDIVFLNKGATSGLEPGQIMDVQIDRTIRDDSTPIRYSSMPSGQIKVAKVSGGCATGVLLKAVDSVQQGDRVQPPSDREEEILDNGPSVKGLSIRYERK